MSVSLFLRVDRVLPGLGCFLSRLFLLFGIDLQTGDNVITVTVRDSSSIVTNTTFTVHSTDTGVVIPSTHAVITLTVL